MEKQDEASPLKILVVDDEPNLRKSLAQSLASLGHPVESALNGEEALTRLGDQAIGLMILDLKLPGMDGIEVLKKASEARPDLRVIMVTAFGTVERAVEAMRLGAVDFLQKPFSPEQIRELVQAVLDRDRLKESEAADYRGRLELAKRSMRQRAFTPALEHVKKAVALDPYRPEAYNLAGAHQQILPPGEVAIRNTRRAVEVDPTFAPARQNLERLVARQGRGEIAWEATAQPVRTWRLDQD